jgi:hypothetical protein
MNILEKAINHNLTSLYSKEIEPYTTILPAESLRRKHNTKTKALIRKLVQDSYLIGLEIINDFKKSDIPIFISRTDVENISRITESMNDEFWNITSEIIQRDNDYKINKKGEMELKPEFDTQARINALSTFIAFRSYNDSVKSKMNIFNINNKQSAGARQPVEEFTLDISNVLESKVMYMTERDSIVCTPETNSWRPCSPLDGKIFKFTDVIPEEEDPPIHKYCRCHLVPVFE